jgi:hypothetical protein
MNIDGLPETGVDAKETCITAPLGQPRIWHDPCDSLPPVLVNRTECDVPYAWVDNDCDPCTPTPAIPAAAGAVARH